VIQKRDEELMNLRSDYFGKVTDCEDLEVEKKKLRRELLEEIAVAKRFEGMIERRIS